MHILKKITPKRKALTNEFKNYLIDSAAGTSFFTPIYTFNELVIAGMPLDVCLKSRLMAAGFGLVINRPYGMFRNWWAAKWKLTTQSSFTKKYAVETAGLAMFQVPISSFMYYVSGASLTEALIAIPSALALGVMLGRPFGIWMDAVRKLSGVEPAIK